MFIQSYISLKKPFPIPEQNGQSVFPFSDQNGAKTLPDGGGGHIPIAYIREYLWTCLFFQYDDWNNAEYA